MKYWIFLSVVILFSSCNGQNINTLTHENVLENQPKNEKGELLDPNTLQVLDPKKTDLGHKPGNEWRTRKKMHQEKGSTRKEVIEAENDPDIYQFEDRNNNRSHRYEKKDDEH